MQQPSEEREECDAEVAPKVEETKGGELSMEFPGSLQDGGIGDIYNPPIGKDYKWYMSGIYCQLGDYTSRIPSIKGTRNNHWNCVFVLLTQPMANL